jgi:lipoprotein-anchoring transpeptidase ErfK/SrfK
MGRWTRFLVLAVVMVLGLAARAERASAAWPDPADLSGIVWASAPTPLAEAQQEAAAKLPEAQQELRLAPTGLAEAGGQKKIVVLLSRQRAAAYQAGVVLRRFPVSTGRNGNTAAGVFRILNKYPAATHARWGYHMPHWMGIYRVGRDWENGFHALPVTPGGRELWRDQIGAPASDGCVVLLPEDMQWLYEWAEVGTPVEIVE